MKKSYIFLILSLILFPITAFSADTCGLSVFCETWCENVNPNPTFELTTTVTPTGSGTITKDPNKAVYDLEETVKLTAAPQEGYKFTHWSGAASDTSLTTSVLMDGDKTVTANFEKTCSLNVSASPADAGSVKVNPAKETYACGDTIILTAEPNENYRFLEWKGISGTDNPLDNITVAGDLAITAVFIGKNALAITPGTIMLEPGKTTSFKVSGGTAPYNWMVNGGTANPTTGEATNYSAPSSSGEYTITVTDSENATATAKASVYSPLAISPQNASIGLGKTTTFTVSGGKTPYTANVNQGDATVSGETVSITAPNEVGTIILTVTDGLNNKVTAQIAMKDDTPPTISPNTVSVGPGNYVQLNVTGGKPEYTWSTEKGTLLTNTGKTVSLQAPEATGTFTVTVTDATSTTTTAQITVMGPLKLNPSIIYGNSGEQVTLDIVGGSGGYFFEVKTGDAPEINGNQAIYTVPDEIGIHWIKVSDAEQNQAISLVFVGNAPTISPSYAYLKPNQIINFKVMNGTAPYTVESDQGKIFESGDGFYQHIAGDTIGIYDVLATDAAGLKAQMTIEVVQPDIKISPRRIHIYPGGSGIFKVVGGKSPYTITAEVGSIMESGQGIYRYEAPSHMDLSGYFYLQAEDAAGSKTTAIIKIAEKIPPPTEAKPQDQHFLTDTQTKADALVYMGSDVSPDSGSTIQITTNFPPYDGDGVDIAIAVMFPPDYSKIYLVDSDGEFVLWLDNYVPVSEAFPLYASAQKEPLVADIIENRAVEASEIGPWFVAYMVYPTGSDASFYDLAIYSFNAQ